MADAQSGQSPIIEDCSEYSNAVKPEAASSGAGSVMAAQLANQRAGGGSIPTPALQSLSVRPIPFAIARELLVKEHYLRSFPGGTHLCFGVFCGKRLMGALTLGAGPAQAYALVDGAEPRDCMALTRLWLSDELPANSESLCIGIVLRALKQHTALKFLFPMPIPPGATWGSSTRPPTGFIPDCPREHRSTTSETASCTTPELCPNSTAPIR